MISKRSFLFVLLAGLLWPLRAAAQETEKAVVFGRDVWPIFVNRCAKCHGPEKQKNDLRLDSPQGISQGGKSGAVIAPGEPLKSILYQRVSTGDWDPMIMPAEGDPLTSQEVGVIRRWIEAGATYEGWTPEMTETVRDALTVKLPPLAELPSRKLEFNRDIRPILSDNCFRCHGPDKNARKAKLRLDVREVALSDLGKRWAIVPGDIERSQLVRRIFHHDETERMPPAESGKSLTEDEKRTLAAWVASGAEYQPHWAYIPPVRPELTSGSDLESPIDALVLARLRGLGLDPSPRADPVTLIRRLSFDLTGLPPTLEQVRRYAESPTEDTYEAVVNELMASPHYGERMALDWLDQVRYADTNGYHSDNPRSIYPYRDYVIEAFNSNKPYDRFTVEQLAGDLLPDATRETRIASGFNRLNQVTAEGGAQEKEYLAEYMADRVRTIGSVWLGATIGCAQCHDHKFDPYTSKDFYAMGAFFADIDEPGVVSSAENYAPYMLLPDEAQARQLADFVAAIGRANEKIRTPTCSLG
ncbi:DUF1549 domain-containing protein, partial [Candidatus Sumerlaeota bacterium]|nr:DUF1549 domain-containing protein [Candidatus Sumerlaeota bacterium]